MTKYTPKLQEMLSEFLGFSLTVNLVKFFAYSMSNGDIIVGYGRVSEPKNGGTIIYEFDDGKWSARTVILDGEIAENVKKQYQRGESGFNNRVEDVEKCIIDTIDNMLDIVDRIKRV